MKAKTIIVMHDGLWRTVRVIRHRQTNINGCDTIECLVMLDGQLEYAYSERI